MGVVRQHQPKKNRTSKRELCMVIPLSCRSTWSKKRQSTSINRHGDTKQAVKKHEKLWLNGKIWLRRDHDAIWCHAFPMKFRGSYKLPYLFSPHSFLGASWSINWKILFANWCLGAATQVSAVQCQCEVVPSNPLVTNVTVCELENGHWKFVDYPAIQWWIFP